MFVACCAGGQAAPVRGLLSTPLATPLAALVYRSHTGGSWPPSSAEGTESFPAPGPAPASPSVKDCVLGSEWSGQSGSCWRRVPSSETRLISGRPTPPVTSSPWSASYTL